MLNTLKGRLYLLAFLIVAPCYVFIYLSFDYSRSIVKDELLQVAEVISSQAADNQEALIESTQRFLISLASLPQLQQPDSTACRHFVTELTKLDERYVNIGVPNALGILTCNGMPLLKPVDVSDRDYIREALDKQRFSTSGVQIDRAVGRPTINFAYPVRHFEDENTVVGAAVVVISLDWWNKLLDKTSLPKQSVAYILDANGNAIVGYPLSAVLDLPTKINQVWRGEDGVGRVFTEHKVLDSEGNLQLTFLMGIGVDDALAAVDRHYTLIISVFSLMVAFVLILFRLFFINSISGPLSTLSELAFRLGRNENVLASPLTGVQEMDDLQDTFIEMAALKRQAEQRIIQQTQTDGLTGIPNRDAFNRQLAESLSHLDAGDHKLGIILLDLDNFKELNDTRGHEAGDDVLKVMATRLIEHCPTAKCISRLGGDEFVFLFAGDDAEETRLLEVCEEIRGLVKQPIDVSPSYGEMIVTSSIGIAVYPDDGENIRELMGAADQAMYHAKKCGRDSVRRFSWSLKDALVQRIELIKDLRHAISNQEFYLVYQPIIDSKGSVVKFEALIRWQHPEKGLIPPDQFIQFAEESGQIIEIGNWVISEAKKALIDIRRVYGDDVQVSVNVSPIQLSNQQGGICVFLESLLTDPDGLKDAQQKNGLVVEITEHLLMNLDENTRKALLDFREKGIQVALDDFGTGHSSLAYVMNHDIDYLKIDKSFVQKLDDESSALSLCEAIILMAHKLGVLVIAEGVETQHQVDLLLGYGCDYLQGFYFSRPISLEQALTYQQNKVI
ncbi:bifunctional diguanylate cyclase/phosphodiesterase [Marinomonas transparens]|uniref:EAL domain-containing protein n=1 Tax=Marinomonas transparens TaxID=2795388 RepID=A0A934JKS1_9GAMM|nr:EAL domain-containing protein [Marinomonas transparens]MBJ7536188.1 EAL domain-containing protein [Marinomonas transparens]